MTQYKFFNPQQATQLAKFQGAYAGGLAGNAAYAGIAAAPTSIYNQAGYSALQDVDTGFVTLQKTGLDSIYTNNWYDQTTGQQFNFPNNKSVFDSSALNGNMTAAQLAELDK